MKEDTGMAGDYGKGQGGKQSIDSTQRSPKDQGGAPKTGFADAPSSECAPKGPGPGVPANTKKIR